MHICFASRWELWWLDDGGIEANQLAFNSAVGGNHDGEL
jgi:hypothetical protein